MTTAASVLRRPGNGSERGPASARFLRSRSSGSTAARCSTRSSPTGRRSSRTSCGPSTTMAGPASTWPCAAAPRRTGRPATWSSRRCIASSLGPATKATTVSFWRMMKVRRPTTSRSSRSSSPQSGVLEAEVSGPRQGDRSPGWPAACCASARSRHRRRARQDLHLPRLRRNPRLPIHDLLEALAPDPTRNDALIWITTYAGIRHAPGIPLYDLMQTASAATTAHVFLMVRRRLHDRPGARRRRPERAPTPHGGPSGTRLPRINSGAACRRTSSGGLHLNFAGRSGRRGLRWRLGHGRDRGRRAMRALQRGWATIPRLRRHVGRSSDDAVMAIAHYEKERRARSSTC